MPKDNRVVVFLQNAWSKLYAGGKWPRASWLLTLERSRSGQRLRVLMDDLDCVENTTPIVGASASSVVPPDEVHIRKVLERRSPDVVVACGQQAERALLSLWKGSLLALPHPASRLVTNELYTQARQLLNGTFRHRCQRLGMRQGKGYIDWVRL